MKNDISVLILLMGLIVLFAILFELSRSKLGKAIADIEKLKMEADRATELHVRELQESCDQIVEIRNKYSTLISEEEELFRLKQEVSEINSQLNTVRGDYSDKRKILDRLEEQIAIYDERLAFAELGVYEPHFEFRDSEDFKKRILEVRERQKSMISAKTAALCPTDWSVGGSKSKGQTMINRQTRLTLRAFNNECDAAIANARWNNVVAMEKRIIAAEQAINKENSSLNLLISGEYSALKIEELRLTHEYRERLKSEKEERVELARSEREEKKLIAEAEAAEREEKKYQDLLARARKELGEDEAGEEMKKRIVDLELALSEAHAKSERARAMAEMTRSGYVYVISNIGSFGADVVKIGLTRRVEPDDRVRELGDASVPFGFDTHAMIYSDEAPALEAALHREFSDRRINMSNLRKEFFKVTIEEVETAVTRLAPSANFFKDREAQEWHETLSRRKQMLEELGAESELFPAEI
jgi:hypothetical protein